MLERTRLDELAGHAIAEARKSIPEDARPHPFVGALLVGQAGDVLAVAHRNEENDGAHAEETLLRKVARDGIDVANATLIVTLEPCTWRGPGGTPCAFRIIECGIQQVVYGMLDPNPDVRGSGELALRHRGVIVERFESPRVQEIWDLCSDFIEMYRGNYLPPESPYVRHQIPIIMKYRLRDRQYDVDLPPGDQVTILDLPAYCGFGDDSSFVDALSEARGYSYDRKYLNAHYDRDLRGLFPRWKDDVLGVLREIGIDDLKGMKVLDVGVGNGPEAVGLFGTSGEGVTLVDAAPESLTRSADLIPGALAVHADAEKLVGVDALSQDVYISLRTYQSTYFDIHAAVREAHRVLRADGALVVSVANGFLEDGRVVPGLLAPGSRSRVDAGLPYAVAERVRYELSRFRFGELGIRTAPTEVFVYARKT